MNDGELREKALHLSSFIVEAPAGSGKTSLLTDRFLKLLTVVDMPEEIVAITFTKKAASEMKAKIIERIKESKSPFAQTILKRSEEKGWDIEHNLSRLKVMTIDKFCHNVVSQIPVLSKMGSKPNITDTPEKFYEESVKQTLQAKDGIEDIKVVFTHYDNEYEKINRRLVAMMSIRDQWKYRCYMLTQKSSGQIIEEGNAYLEHLTKPIYQKISAELNQDQLNDLIEILHYLESTNLREDIKLNNKNSFNFDSEEIPLWQTITKILFTDKNTRRENITAREGFKNDDEGEIYKNKCRNLPNIDFLLAIKAIPEPLSETYALKLKSIANILLQCEKKLRQLFKQRNTVDFIEIIEIANEALGKNDAASDLLLSLDYKISHLLIDEFQDTSRSHFNFLKKIVDGWTPEAQKTIFCVGDPMQSIYKFREADVSIFIEAKKNGFNTIPLETIQLRDNYRSSSIIVNEINQIFENILPKEDSIQEGAVSYKPFVSAKKEHDSNVSEFKFHALTFTESTDIDTEEAKYVCNLIDTFPENEKIAILTRSRSHLSELINYIRKFKPTLKFNAVEIDALDKHQSIQDILSLSYAMLDLNDRIHWLAILRAPWCGIMLSDLALLFQNDHTSTVWEIIQDENKMSEISPDGRRRIRRLIDILKNAFDNQSKTHIRRLIESVWMNLGGELCLHNPNDIVDINKFFNILQTSSSPIAIDFELVEHQITKTYLSDIPSAEERIQFFTIHKAKGLEFDTVIIPSLNSTTRASDKKMIVSDASVKNSRIFDITAFSEPDNKSPHLHDLIYGIEKSREENELKRLLYVAMTRAKTKLHLVGSVMHKDEIKPASNSFLSMLWNIYGNNFYEVKPIENIDIDIESSKIEEFVPKLMRLKLI
jgi:ATP-dependent exoDNAse (exonuclease V) beta subunit